MTTNLETEEITVELSSDVIRGRDVDMAAAVRGCGSGYNVVGHGTDRSGRVQCRHCKSQRKNQKKEAVNRSRSKDPKSANGSRGSGGGGSGSGGGGWRAKLNMCRYPSTESIADIDMACSSSAALGPKSKANGRCTCGTFRRSSSVENGRGDRDSATPPFNSAVPHSADTVTQEPSAPVQPTLADMQSSSAAARSSSHAVTTQSPATPAPPVGRQLKNSAFCPCFSPNDSDDEIDTARISEQRPQQITGTRQLMALARELRTRFAIAADATNQSGPVPVNNSVTDGSVEHVAEPYPVHTAVEYTHYLVPDLISVTNAAYYWGVMDRFEAEKLLDGKAEGTFLLRDSAQSEYLFSVSFRRYGRTLHARIEQLHHQFSFDSYDPGVFAAPTVCQLIEHYKDPSRCMFFEPQLSQPLNRTFVFPLQHLCRAAVCQDLSYTDIQSLPVPRKFKDYLRDYHYKQVVRTRNLEANT